MVVTRRPLARRPLLWAVLGLAGFVIVLATMFVAAVPLSSESFRHRLVRSLSETLDSDVELGDLHLRVFPGLHAEGVNLRVRRRGMGAYPPLISVRAFRVDASLIGLWHRDEPGDTPLEGAFTFAKADLGVFKGISGTLSSRGNFGGTLAELEARGETDTPDFTIKVGGHPFPLHVDYQALIDGTNGDTRLTAIDARFLGSRLHATGAVLGPPKGHQGRTITLDVAMDNSRIEDIMTMVVATATPLVVGGLTLTTTLVLPPGRNEVLERLRLDGRFTINRARFTYDGAQGKIEELSKRGRGKASKPEMAQVVSDFQGRFTLADGRLALPGLTFAVPGAKVELAGTYGLKAGTLDFRGHLLPDGSISQAATGWKSVLLKAVDPIFRQEDGTGSAIPISIGGTRNAPEFGVDVRRVFKHGGD